jgi:hypothetical protein
MNIGGEEKARALRKHLIEHIPVGTVCDKLGVALECILYLAGGVILRPACEI